MTTSVILLSIFAISIGYATFAENNHGTEYAKSIVYNAKWFELLLALLIVNLLGSILKNKLIQRKKWSVLMFHLAFVFILIGSAITRYFSYEGLMHIRQGETTNLISTDKTAVNISAEYNGQKVDKSTEVDFGPTKTNDFLQKIEVGGKTFTIENKLFVPNAVETIQENENGDPVVGIFIMSAADESTDIMLFENEKKVSGDITFAFENTKDSADIMFSVKGNDLYFKSKQPFTKTGTMASGMIDRENAVTIPADQICPAENNTVYRSGKVVFMIKGFYPKAVKTLTVNTETSKTPTDALVMEIKDGNTTKQVNVFNTGDKSTSTETCYINGVKMSISFGKLQREIPFNLTLRKFELERYQGSMSPSSYASEITVTDNEKKTVIPFRIFMNNILNYRGYRFFQSSYDNDEMGTVLSVNHDQWGTMVTYFGYFFLFLGMALTLFSKKSRFSTLLRLTNEIQQKRKQGTYIVITLIFSTLFGISAHAQNTSSKAEHIKLLDKLLVQDGAQGRIEPLCSYTSDVLRKIYKHDSFKGQSATEVILGMSVQPSLWQNQPMIKVSNPELEKELGAVGGYVSFNQLFDKNGSYKLSSLVEAAYQKEESMRNKYEKEIINVDERINICNLIFTHDLLAIFPNKNDENGKWLITKPVAMSTNDKTSVCPYISEKENNPEMSMAETEMGTTMGGNGMGTLKPDVSGACTRNSVHGQMNMNSAMTNSLAADSPEKLYSDYLNSVSQAMASGNWLNANTALAKIKAYQIKNGGSNLPSASKIKLEIAYNKWSIFFYLMIAYAIFGSLLLMLHFICIFKPNVRLEKLLSYGIYPLTLLLIIYTIGLAIRWYISGHAPWSNGYESMIFVGWAAGLSGFIFARKSPVAFAVTALLSAIALSVAAMSWMNPEITNLVPVLKSYWLVIHVAIITSSYGFLAMAALLGLINLALMVARNVKNSARINSNILEFSYIIELSLIVGLFMLTIGTFIGGIWANESWGRYWGWDAKETWALVSVLVYAIILHLRLIPALNRPIVISTMSLFGFSSVIMTFLGVNYYLAGMHSYGKGTPPPVPSAVYLVIIALVFLIYFAYKSEKKGR